MSGGETLDGVKRRLRETYLGVSGIHGLGLNRAAAAVRVYCDPGDSSERQAVLERLRRDAAPFAIEIVSEPPPRIG
jgi:hypothetical protein